MRTATDSYASTFPRVPTCLDGQPKTSPPSPTRSTTDQEKSLDFEPQSKSSMNNYNQFKTTVLQPPIESKVYTSQAFRDHCSSLGVRQSMGAVGSSADNALAESFNATLKREVLRDGKVFDNPVACRREVFRWCMRYNTRRRQSWCNLVAPDVFETAASATLAEAA